MKAKHIPIKRYSCRVKRKGKTRGRPSNYEIYISAFLSHKLEDIKPEVNKAMVDMMIYGTGIIKFSKK